ncbi:MAG: type II toxin-antitoxin system Phd/YefM family antitoxin [Crocosphaera sp.]
MFEYQVIKTVTLAELQKNPDKLLDEILKNGIPLEVNKHGKFLRIVPMEKKEKLDNLVLKTNIIQGNPDI